MIWIVMIFVVFFGAILQAMLPSLTYLEFIRPPVLLVFICYYALTHKMNIILIAALFGGFLQDALSLIPLGISPLSFTITVFIITSLRERFFSRQPLFLIICGFTAGMIESCVVYGILLLKGDMPFSFSYLLLKSLGSGLWGALLLLIFYPLIYRLDQCVGNVEVRRL